MIPYVGKVRNPGRGKRLWGQSSKRELAATTTTCDDSFYEHRPTRAQGRDRLGYRTTRAVVGEVYAEACGGRIAIQLED